MATQIHPNIEFFPRPVDHAPSPLGFGFGLSSSSSAPFGRPSAVHHVHSSPSVFHLSSAANQPPTTHQRNQKRRHEPEDEDGRHTDLRDEAMDRSPTPERPKRAVPKRARIAPGVGASGKEDKFRKEDKSPSDDNDVDVGMLLASLPQESLLPLLTALIEAQPSLRTTILSLIPRPTVETALQALSQSAKRLRDAYPYSTVSSFSQPSSLTSFGFGSGFGAGRQSTFGNASGFGRQQQSAQSSFGASSQSDSGVHGGMRNSYILSRLAPHISEFVSTALSYVLYFSYMSTSTSSSSAEQTQPKDRASPTETYRYLAALTSHLLSQPQLAQSSLAPLLLPRLLPEWNAWIDRVDEIVNKEGGMFGSETVKMWERSLDEYAEAKEHGLEVLRELRDKWVARVGWLVGRTSTHPMDEEEEL